MAGSGRGVNFKLSGQTKVVATGILDPHERGEYLRLMIEAQKTAENFQNSRAKTRDSIPKTGE
jgi:hypothetical protein